MNCKRSKFNLLLWLTFLPLIAVSQINDSLQIIGENIRVVNDTSDPNFERLSRSRDYNMRVLGDTLIIEIAEKDSVIVPDNSKCYIDTLFIR